MRTEAAERTSLLDCWTPALTSARPQLVLLTAAGAELTVDHDRDLLVVYLSSGGHAGLTVVNSLVCLLDAADLEVTVVQHPETH